MASKTTTPGICYLVGAGPGDPGLLTLKGKECIEAADVLVYDYLCNPEHLRYAKPGTERINDVRTKEALDTGAKKIATSCSFCLLMLQSSVPSDGPRRVFDIAELVAEALPEASPPAGAAGAAAQETAS